MEADGTGRPAVRRPGATTAALACLAILAAPSGPAAAAADAVTATAATLPVAGQVTQPATEPASDVGSVLLVVDASGSMKDADVSGEPKMAGARRALTQLVHELPPGTPVGLRVFGEGEAMAANPATCTDTRLAVPVSPLDRERVAAAVAGIEARGWTPIGYALQHAGRDLPTSGRVSVILVSDGIDECFPGFGPEPCEVAASLTRAAVDLKVHTIGLTVDQRARDQLQCIARVTGGDYWDADDAGSLAGALRDSVQPPPPPPVLPEPESSGLLGPAAVLTAAAAVLLGVGAGVQSVRGRRRRAYW